MFIVATSSSRKLVFAFFTVSHLYGRRVLRITNCKLIALLLCQVFKLCCGGGSFAVLVTTFLCSLLSFVFFFSPFSFAPVFSLSPSESDFTLLFTVVCRISSNLYVSKLHKNSFFLPAFTSSCILKLKKQ